MTERKDRTRPKARPQRLWSCRPSADRLAKWANAPRPARERRTLSDGRYLRAVLTEAQDGRCGLCGRRMYGIDETLDHVIPWAMQGADGLGNLLVAHRPCNTRKANDAPTGCELVWLLAVNARLGVLPVRW